MQRFLVFDFYAEIIHRAEVAAHVSTVVADELVALKPPEDVLYEVLHACSFELLLKAVEKHVSKLVRIRLNRSVCWVSIVVLEGISELERIVVRTF